MRYRFALLGICLGLVSFGGLGCGGGSAGSGGSSTNPNTPPANPSPSLTSISPDSITVGSAQTKITATGSGFISTSAISWNGTALATSYTNSTSLTAEIPSTYLQAEEKVTVTVTTPTPGGGTSKGVTFTVSPPPNNPVPALTSISPVAAPANSPALEITAKGSGFIPTSTITWSGYYLTTSYTNPTTLTAQVPAYQLQSPGSVSVNVINPNPGGGTSASLNFTVGPPVIPGVTVLTLPANDLAWDPVNQVIYLSLPSTDGSNGNTVQILNPQTAKLGASAFAGSEPNLLSVSQNSQYLYVSQNGSSTVQVMTLPNLGSDITINLGASSFFGPYYAMDLQAAPDSADTVAVVRGTPDYSPEEQGGVWIYDNGVARPDALCGWTESGCVNNPPALYDTIQWNPAGAEMYAANNEDTAFDFYTIVVSPSGFGAVTDYPGVFQEFGARIHYDATTG
jgi:hypothetical protein